MKNKLTLLFTALLFTALSACSNHSHYDQEHISRPISWGYTVGDPILYGGGTGYTGNFYPYASPYGAVVYEGEGAIAP